ncbi:MAG TPA: valine--tRNA ligase [Dehalococcoidia bacterium]|nr:valine--tRNA ligase [Dehalococcoidia bacterium]
MSQPERSKPQEMAKAYDPRATEDRVYHFWESRGYFKGAAAPGKQPFSIVMPPPNVTGELHIGHALTDTVEDILIRWHRMLGDPTLWVPGVDHAGIATQTAVERMLAKEGVSRHDLGRDAFEAKVWEWVRRYRPIISNQHRRLGASADWSREVFTLDDGPQSAVRTVFKKMFDDGLIYRGERLINWCPRCLSALSDLEVDHEEQQGSLWYIRYPIVDGADANGTPRETGEHLVVATTRPETYVGDTAVAVHPKDERFAKYIGRSVMLPVIQRVVPVIGDDAVEVEFGTGAVKVTPGHDPTDFEIGQRHDLPIINVMNEDATMNDQAGPYAGMDRAEARKAIVRDLEELRYLEKIEPHTSQVGTCYRCHTVIEPLMSWQWFVNQRALAGPGIDAVKAGRIRFVPERFERIYLNWMENIRDWCVSRQLWWGHRIPVWYSADEDGDRIMVKLPQDVAEGKAPAAPGDSQPMTAVPQAANKEGQPPPSMAATYNEFRARGLSHETIVKYGTWSAVGATPICSIETPAHSPTGGGNLLQESDVLDTWFSSGLWPFSTLGWPRETDELKYWYPTSVMETGYDIIFLWVARMIMLGLYCVGEIPYSVVYLHGTVRNEEGKRMSKSLGTGVDPLEVVEQYGADALRYALITASGPGNDLKLSMQRVEMSRNFANKLWNATRFVLSMIGDADVGIAPLVASLENPEARPENLAGLPLEDRWILSRVEGLARSVDDLMRRFELGEAMRQVYEFVWNDFCDWYIEIAKVRVRGDGAQAPSPAQVTEAPSPAQVTEAPSPARVARVSAVQPPSPLPVLAYVLDRSLRLLHPAMPFVTEELWQALQSKIAGPSVGAQPAAPAPPMAEEALIVAAFPRGEGGYADAEAEREMESLIDVVRAIRNIRAEKKVEPAKFIEAYVVADGARSLFEAGRPYVETLARVRPLHVVSAAAEAPRDQVATAVLEGVTAVVPLAGLFDVEVERARLRKQIAEAETEAGRIESKLSNEGFRAKAPEKVIAQETERLGAVRGRLEGLRKSLGELG